LPSLSIQTGRSLSSSTTLSVDPSSVDAPLGGTLTVSITVGNVSDLAGWGFKVYWLRDVLNGTSIVEGPFLKQAGQTFLNVLNFTDDYNSTHGLAWVEAVLYGPGPGAYGSGTLASISFQTKKGGSTALWLSETSLVDSDANQIPHSDASGMVYVLFHDVAIAGVNHSKTVVCQGYSANVTVTAENLGNYTESFNVSVYANSTPIAFAGIDLQNGSTTTVTLSWNTTGTARGNYAISAYASPVPGETNTANNNLTGGWIIVSMVGDILGEGKVSGDDLILLAWSFGSSAGPPPSPRWNPNADIYNDGKISGDDLIVAAKKFGQSDP
jgi:hypothetical protein